MYLFIFISGLIAGYFVSQINLRDILRNIFDFSEMPNKVSIIFMKKKTYCKGSRIKFAHFHNPNFFCFYFSAIKIFVKQ